MVQTKPKQGAAVPVWVSHMGGRGQVLEACNCSESCYKDMDVLLLLVV